jgi:hypothetical protein
VDTLEAPLVHVSLADYKKDSRKRMEAQRRQLAKATDSFRHFVVETLGYDGTRGLSQRQKDAGMRAQGADGIDFSDRAYDPVWAWFETARTRSSLLMLPRFTGKTTLIALWCLWLGLKNPNIRIGLVAYKFDLASEILAMVRAWMSTDLKGDLRKVFPKDRLPVPGEKWGRDDYLDFPGKTTVQRDHTIAAVGMMEASEGGHFEIVILEDLVNKVSTQTATSIEQVKQFVRDASGLGMVLMDDFGNPMGRAPKVMVGTPWDGSDAYMDAIAAAEKSVKQGQKPDWTILRLPCRIPRKVTTFVRGPEDRAPTPLVKEEYDETCTPRFRHQPDALLREYRYAHDGFGAIAYASQFDLRPIPIGNRMMRREWFEDHFYEDEEIWEKKADKEPTLKPMMGVALFSDLSGTSGASKDRTAHQAWAMNPSGHLYLLDETVGRFAPDDEDDERLTPNSNLDFLAKWTKRYKAKFIGVEGGVLRTVYDSLVKKWNRLHRDRQILMVKVASGGARGNRTNDRAMAIAQLAEAGMIHIKRSQADYLVELLSYSPENDNTPDDRVACTALACINNSFWPRDIKPKEKKKFNPRSVADHIDQVVKAGKPKNSLMETYSVDG